MSDEIRYSVVVPTYSRVSDLKLCLESLVRQSSTQYEIIIVDDCSPHDARTTVDDVMRVNSHIPFQYIRREKNGGHGAARNTGVQVARGSIILFTDDDCIPPANWIETHVDAHRRYPEAAGVGGWYWPPNENYAPNAYDRFFKLQYEYSYPGTRDCELWTNTMYSPAGNTANMSYKTDVYRALGGFDEKIYFTGGIDWELKARCIALGHSLVSIPLSVQHTKYFTFKSFVTKTVKLGRGTDYMASKYPSLMRPSLYAAISLYGSWNSHATVKGEKASVALLWGLCLMVGKWINRVLNFKPDMAYQMRSERYFTYRQKNSVRIMSHELMPFDALKSQAEFIESTTRHAAVPRYSVIIPTYNRKEFLVGAIDAVLQQEDVPPELYEIIVVDDGSNDGTEKAVADVMADNPHRIIRYHYQDNQGAALARNTGASLARGEILFFTDSDCRVPKKWLWATVQAYLQHPLIVGTGGGQLTRKTGATALDHFRSTSSDNLFVSRYGNVIAISNDTTTGVIAYDSASMSVRKEVFNRVGGFIPIGSREVGYYHEDVEFVCRVQKFEGPMALVPNTYALNQRLLRFKSFCKVAFTRGAALPFLVERIYPHAVLVRDEPRAAYVVAQFLKCLLHPFRTMEWVSFCSALSYSAGYRHGRNVKDQKSGLR